MAKAPYLEPCLFSKLYEQELVLSKEIYVYLIVCSDDKHTYVKIGKTINLYQRIKNLQTGSPLEYTNIFVIDSLYEEEVLGLEILFHSHLPEKIRGEWYLGSDYFFDSLLRLIQKINDCEFTAEEIDLLPDHNTGPSLEIMLHGHSFEFNQVTLPLKKRRNLAQLSMKITYDQFVKEIRR